MATSASKSERSGGFVNVDITGPVTTRSPEVGEIEITTPSGYRVTVAHDL